jgi:hypothetical protein
MGCGASTNKSTDDVAEQGSFSNGKGAQTVTFTQRQDSSILAAGQSGRNDSNAPTVSVGRMSQSSLVSQQQTVGGMPIYTIIDGCGCRVASCIQSKPKVDSVCRWIDQARKFRQDVGGILQNPQDSGARAKDPATEPTPRETSSVSSNNKLAAGTNSTTPESGAGSPFLPMFKASLHVGTDSENRDPLDQGDSEL